MTELQQMKPTLDPLSFYSAIVSHTSLDLMTKLTEYPSPAKQEAKIEAQRQSAEARVLQNAMVLSD